jgi:hypothetical protein
MAGKKEARAAFRAAVFKRDRYRRVMCGKDRQGGDSHTMYHRGTPDEELVPLDAHHITDRNDMPNGGYVLANGITLCDDGCHFRAEIYHQTGTPHPGYSPAELYARVGSCYEEAHRASLALL